MEIEITKTQNKSFVPLKLTIKIESEEDLLALTAIHNHEVVYSSIIEESPSSPRLYEQLQVQCKELGLSEKAHTKYLEFDKKVMEYSIFEAEGGSGEQ